MNALFRMRLLTPASLLCLLLFTGCSREPAGYSYMLKNNAAHANAVGDPAKASEYAAQWVQDWRASLAFFTAELDSSDPDHVKTSMLCLTFLALEAEKNKDSLGAEGMAEFGKQFPVAKLKKLTTDNPNYYTWLYGIKYSSRFGPQLPPPPGWKMPD